MSGFAENAHAWTAAGWGALPLPNGKKSPPPTGWTGRGTPYPSGADVQAWIEEEDDANLALRFPAGVVGLDVDEYDAGDGTRKHGLQTVKNHAATWGPPGAAPRITSRPEGPSGIYLYRLPDDVTSDRFLSELPGGHVEILRPEHRYAVGPGSTHPEGRPYVLLGFDGGAAGVAPRREDLPELPAAWVEGLTVPEKPAVAPSVELASGRGDRYAQSAVERVVAELHAIASWKVGQRDDRGRGWEKIQADAAYRLASLALADWNSLTVEQAMHAFGAAAPIGGEWTGADVASKWRSQVHRAEPATAPRDSDDPLSPGYVGPSNQEVQRATSSTSVGNVGAGAVTAVADTLTTQAAANWVKHSWDDRGNAERVVERFGSRLRYMSAVDRWMIYDAQRGRWEENKLAGYRAMIEMIDELPHLELALYSTAPRKKTKDKDTSDREEFEEWLAGQRSDTRYRAGANVIKGLGLLDESPTAFDANPDLLNCRNGIVDLRTGELLPHDPVHKLSRQVPVHYDPNAPAPRWEDYLQHVQPDGEVREYLQRVAGYSITGLTREQVFFIHQGPPNTGKSVFINIMLAMLGPDQLARVIPASVLMAKRNEGHPTEIMGLAGRRMLTSSESAEGARLDAALVKRLSGSDFLTARGMGQDFQDFKLVGKIHLATNHLPHIPDDAALRRRIHVVPWNVVIPPGEVDYELEEDVVRAELPGVLAWAVRGALAWRRDRLRRPAAASAVTQDYFDDEDEFGEFIRESLVPTDGVVWTKTKVVYQTYLHWCDSNRLKYPMSKIAFSRKLSARGFAARRDMKDRGFACTLLGDPVNAPPDPFAN